MGILLKRLENYHRVYGVPMIDWAAKSINELVMVAKQRRRCDYSSLSEYSNYELDFASINNPRDVGWDREGRSGFT
jgi:hypothetical protein